MVDWIQSSQINVPFTISDDEDEIDDVYFGSFRADVVGIRYYTGKVNNNEMVSLRREPQNKYDRNAIRVDNVLRQQVGHIKREQAAALAPLVDKKYARLEGVVPFGVKNKFSMPCDITLSGPTEHKERCQDMMAMRGYRLKPILHEGYSDGGVWRDIFNSPGPQQSGANRAPSRPLQYTARNTANKELVNLTMQQNKHELDKLLDCTFDKDEFAQKESYDVVKSLLYPHQKQALAWMISRENGDELPPFWERKANNYTNTLVNFTTGRKPEVVRGGVLADEMGLGKTLSIISLIVTNYKNNQPLVTVDKSSTVQHHVVTKKPNQRKRSSVEKLTKKIILCDDEDEDGEDEPALPSFTMKEDVDYKPKVEDSVTRETDSIASQRSRRLSNKKPRYNFDDEEGDWLNEDAIDSAISPTIKKRKIPNTKKKTTSLDLKSSEQGLKDSEKENVQHFHETSQKDMCEISTSKIQGEIVTGFKVSRVNLPGPRSTLIVCPLSVMQNWLDQLENHVEYGALDVYCYYGYDRTKHADSLATKDVVLTTYQTLSSDFSKMQKSNFKTKSALHQVTWLRIVLDEGHCIRNMTSNQSKACIALNAERRWIVTGTPVQNTIKDLWSIICFLRIEPLNKKEWWVRIIEKPLTNPRQDDNPTKALKRLQAILLKILIRRTKQHKVKGKPVVELPKKSVFIQYVEFTEDEKKLYETFKNEGQAILARYISANTLASNYAHMLVILMRLRQLCCHPKLCAQIIDFFKDISNPNSSVTPDELRKKLQQILSVLLSSGNEECPICLDDLNNPVITHCAHLFCRQCIESVIKADKPLCPLCRGNIAMNQLVEPAVEKETVDSMNCAAATNTWSSSSKVDGLITILNKETEEDPRRKHLIVSQFTQFLNLLEKPLQESGFNFVRLDGSMNVKKRNDAISVFSDKTDGSPTLMLLSLKAGGVGLNLTAATRVFLMDPAWNPAAEEQCFDRCHRLGQVEEVKIYKFIVKDTVEERMLELQNVKKDLMNRTFRQEQRLRDVQKLLS